MTRLVVVLACLVALLGGALWWLWRDGPAPVGRTPSVVPVAVRAHERAVATAEAATAQADTVRDAVRTTRRAARTLRDARVTRPRDLSAVLVDTGAARYVTQLEATGDTLAAEATSLSLLAELLADSLTAQAARHVTETDALRRAAEAVERETATAIRRESRRKLVTGVVLGAGLTLTVLGLVALVGAAQ